MDVLRVATAGSVDDGKSTLIGRVLYETNSIAQDKLAQIESRSKSNGYDYLDLSLITDGLTAEREQGITIDVAHIYFSTDKRNYIIADSPGHIEYTRNMVTGASNSQASIVLIDARNGVLEQTVRHVFINKLLGIQNLVFAINKMDLADYSEEVFNRLSKDVSNILAKQAYSPKFTTCIPVSALHGDMIAERKKAMSWYTGPTLLDVLESLDTSDITIEEPMRFVVQNVIRPKTNALSDFRGYAGRLNGGKLKKGEHVTVLPTLQSSTISDIQFFNQSYEEALPGSSCLVCLEDDIDISRGSILVQTDDIPDLSRELDATLCWMDNRQLTLSGKYLLQQGSKTVKAKVTAVTGVYARDFELKTSEVQGLNLNDIGKVNIKIATPVIHDDFSTQRTTGRFILIDDQTNNTVAVGFIDVR